MLEKWANNLYTRSWGQYIDGHHRNQHCQSEWARCYITGGITHNMHVENWHEQLKTEKWEGRLKVRIDKLIEVMGK